MYRTRQEQSKPHRIYTCKEARSPQGIALAERCDSRASFREVLSIGWSMQASATAAASVVVTASRRRCRRRTGRRRRCPACRCGTRTSPTAARTRGAASPRTSTRRCPRRAPCSSSAPCWSVPLLAPAPRGTPAARALGRPRRVATPPACPPRGGGDAPRKRGRTARRAWAWRGGEPQPGEGNRAALGTTKPSLGTTRRRWTRAACAGAGAGVCARAWKGCGGGGGLAEPLESARAPRFHRFALSSSLVPQPVDCVWCGERRGRLAFEGEDVARASRSYSLPRFLVVFARGHRRAKIQARLDRHMIARGRSYETRLC